jgi:acyl-CoA synthetase (AMP-forming)/AMP-acid ligase II
MKLDAAALAYHCASRLAGYKRPREFRFVDALPRNAAGKLQRRRLTEIEILT